MQQPLALLWLLLWLVVNSSEELLPCSNRLLVFRFCCCCLCYSGKVHIILDPV